MLSRRLKTDDRAPSAIVITTGYILGRKLTFDKVSKDGSGKCDIEETHDLNNRVYGVLFEIDDKEEKTLDKAEGLGGGYNKIRIRVLTSNGEYKAITYVAAIKDPKILPYDWYKAYVVKGAIKHNLPTDYINWIQTFNTKRDPNIRRSLINKIKLFIS